MKDRVVAKGGEYIIPESFNTFSASSEDVAKLIQENINNESGLNASKFFATKLGLGGEYSRQVCEKLGMGLEESLDKIDSKKVVESIKEILLRDVDFKYLEDNYYNTTPKKENNILKKIEKIKIILEEQKKTLARVEIDSEENNCIGNLIYENYGFFEDLRKAHEYAEENGKNLNDAIDKLKKKHEFVGNIKFEKPFVEVEIDTKQ